jgi:hypothetical protein
VEAPDPLQLISREHAPDSERPVQPLHPQVVRLEAGVRRSASGVSQDTVTIPLVCPHLLPGR